MAFYFEGCCSSALTEDHGLHFEIYLLIND